MRLTPEQLERFDRDGYLFFPSLFGAEEIAVLKAEVPSLYAQHRPEIVREKGSDAVRTVFAAHLMNEAFAKLGRHPRMIGPAQQLFGEPVYMHQFKVNGKQAFDGDVWQWHQDYGTWKRDDGMMLPRAMNISIFLDEVMPINGPLMLVPKSHNAGDLKAAHDLQTTSYPLWTLDEETVTRLVKEGGIVAPTGKPGTVVIFDCNVMHGSNGNITPFPRANAFLVYNAVGNALDAPFGVEKPRPDFIAARGEPQTIRPVTGSLAEEAPV